MFFIISLAIATYFLGSVPFGLVVARIKGIDLRKVGSGNIGATNVFRALGIKWAILVFFLDGLKGFLPVLLTIVLFPEKSFLHILIGAIAIVGHSLSLFVKFKGGKGAATGLGVLLALSPIIFGITAVIAFLTIWFSRYVSVGTMLCCLLLPLFFMAFRYPAEYVIFVGVICFFVILRHRPNIERLLKGTENKIR
jgi:glycerol-3-phosphate acyltransferase PlsY